MATNTKHPEFRDKPLAFINKIRAVGTFLVLFAIITLDFGMLIPTACEGNGNQHRRKSPE